MLSIREQVLMSFVGARYATGVGEGQLPDDAFPVNTVSDLSQECEVSGSLLEHILANNRFVTLKKDHLTVSSGKTEVKTAVLEKWY